MEMLVNPIPQPLGDKTDWETFLEEVKSLPLQILQDRAKSICDEVEDEQLRNVFRRELKTAGSEGDQPEVLIFVALKTGILTAYVHYPPASNCYAIKSFYWHTFSQRAVALRAIETGVARLNIRDLLPQSIESEVANGPLFVKVDAKKDLLNLRPPSKGSLERLASKIISEHQASTVRKLLKQDFVSELIRLSPGCSKERAQAAWARHAPAA